MLSIKCCGSGVDVRFIERQRSMTTRNWMGFEVMLAHSTSKGSAQMSSVTGQVRLLLSYLFSAVIGCVVLLPKLPRVAFLSPASAWKSHDQVQVQAQVTGTGTGTGTVGLCLKGNCTWCRFAVHGSSVVREG